MGRGRRTSQDFAEAAAGIVAEAGWPALTPPALAEQLGVHATAVYRHFATWNDLIVAVFDLSIARILSDAMEALPKNASPRDRIIGFLRTVRAATEADPYLAECVSAILSTGTLTVMPNLDAASRQIAELLRQMGVPSSELPTMYQAIEGFIIGSVIVDFTGHPNHIVNRRHRRRMSGVPEFEEFTRSDEATMAVSQAAFELNARLLLDECERLAGTSQNVKKPSNR